MMSMLLVQNQQLLMQQQNMMFMFLNQMQNTSTTNSNHRSSPCSADISTTTTSGAQNQQQQQQQQHIHQQQPATPSSWKHCSPSLNNCVVSTDNMIGTLIGHPAEQHHQLQHQQNQQQPQLIQHHHHNQHQQPQQEQQQQHQQPQSQQQQLQDQHHPTQQANDENNNHHLDHLDVRASQDTMPLIDGSHYLTPTTFDIEQFVNNKNDEDHLFHEISSVMGANSETDGDMLFSNNEHSLNNGAGNNISIQIVPNSKQNLKDSKAKVIQQLKISNISKFLRQVHPEST